MMSVCIRCICLELADAVFSSKLNILASKAMETSNIEQFTDLRQRPWGSFTVLDEGENYKVKRIEVLPGKRLSYQRHSRRAEHWYVVRGTAKVTLNGSEILVKAGERSTSRSATPTGSRTLTLPKRSFSSRPNRRLFWRRRY